MAYAPANLPAYAAITVGTEETTITSPAAPKVGAWLSYRGNVDIHLGVAQGTTTDNGVLVPKNTQYFIPREAFEGTRSLYVISGSEDQKLDVVIV